MSGPRCCGCFTLRQGSIALGVLQVVASCFAVISCIGGIVLIEMKRDGSQFDGFNDGLEWDHDGGLTTRMSEYAFIGGLVYSLSHLFFACLLVHGARKDRPSLLMAWLVWAVACFTVETMASAFDVASVSSMGVCTKYIVAKWLVAMTKVCLLWYWFSVVLAHYRNLKMIQACGGLSNYNRLLEDMEPPAVNEEVKKQPVPA